MNQVSQHVPAHEARDTFPFSALIGQPELQQALLLAAVDPGIGGVLVSGPRGTAKSTAARALAELLPQGRFVTLPLGASEDRLIGSLDLEAALQDGAVRFSPGLLASAHQGVLYVDEVNLLPDGLVDALLDAAASGVNTVERDGVSHRHEASFVLIGTMNPEEGELRPQLTDRFGLMVALQNCFDPLMRQRIVKARLAFDADPVAFRAACAAQQEDCAQRIRAARERFGSLAFDDTVHARVSALCIAAHVDGMRADLVMLRAARALAALEGAQAVSVAHVERVAEAVLLHRRRDEASSSIGVPEQHAHDSAVAPPTGEPAAAPAAASGSPPAATLGTAPAATFGTTPGITPAATPGTASGAAPGTLPAAPAGDSDWGYLAPEPTGTRSVKGVIPLALKKR